MKKLHPYLLITLFLGITINLWIISKISVSDIWTQPLRSGSQILALLGTVLTSVTLALSTRIKKVEDFFGGLDKVYGAHHLFGTFGFIFLLHHPMLLILQALPMEKLASMYLILGADLSYNLGILSLYTMIFGFVSMVFVKLPYHIWIWTHKILGLGFLLGGVHGLLISSDISSNLPLRIWMILWIVIGITSAIYTIIFYKKFSKRIMYSVVSLERKKDIVIITLKPKGKRPLQFIAGQFVYVEFLDDIIGRENHPFSIASSPNEENLRIAVKMVGDYTKKLPLLEEGVTALVYGPYGRFYPETNIVESACVWIGGGIGITPFLSKLRAELIKQTANKILLYYVYRTEDDGVFAREILELSSQVPNVEVVLCCTSTSGRLSVKAISEKIPVTNISSVLLCGPTAMMHHFSNAFQKVGVREDNIYFEEFSFI